MEVLQTPEYGMKCWEGESVKVFESQVFENLTLKLLTVIIFRFFLNEFEMSPLIYFIGTEKHLDAIKKGNLGINLIYSKQSIFTHFPFMLIK